MPEIIGGVAAYTQPAAPAPASDRTKDTLGKDAFLKLLVAQLKYQDPSKPADSAQFMAQTAQFTMVEKLEEIAAQNAELLSASRALGASGLVGRTVVATGPLGEDVTGVVTGVTFEPTGPVLKVGDTTLPLTAVKEVRSTGA